MKIAVLGAGMVGQALAGKLSELGHDVTRLKTGMLRAPRA
jgi:Trk K+ transport system NAD-binding subunit